MSTLLPVYRTTIFAPPSVDFTETTVLTPAAGAAHSDPFQIATSEGVTGFKPYMGMPSGRRGRLDILAKKTDTGQLTFSLVDVRVTPGGSNALRWGTAFLGTPMQSPRFTKLRTLIEESLDGGVTWNTFFTGRASIIQLQSGSRLWLSVTVNDYAGDLTHFNCFVGMPHASVLSNVMPAIVSNTAANPTVVQVASPYGLLGTFTVSISGSTDPAINGTFLATSVDATHFSLPVTGAGGSGGSWSMGKNPPQGYAQLVSVMPVGFIHPYGVNPTTPELFATVASIDVTNGWAVINLNSDQRDLRKDNILNDTLLRGLNPGASPMAFPTTSVIAAGSTFSPAFSGIAYAHITNLSTGQQGDFLVGYATVTPSAAHSIMAGSPLLSAPPVWGVVIRPLMLPVGVATTTGASPLVNGAQTASPTSATSTIATKGWTLSTTKILGQGDIISFAGHNQRYVVTADTNSDGSGNASVIVKPGLKANIANSEIIKVQQQPGRMPIPAVSTNIKLSVTCDLRMADGGSTTPLYNAAGAKVGDTFLPGNITLINDVHPAKLLRDVLQGYFGRILRPAVEPISQLPTLGLPPGADVGDVAHAIPVMDADPIGDGRHGFTALMADNTFPPFRCPIMQRMTIADFIEKYICKPYGIGYYFDASGNFVPVDLRQPATLTGVPALTDTDLVLTTAPDWSYDSTQAYAQSAFTVYAEAIVHPIASVMQPGNQFPVISGSMFQEISSQIVDLGFGNVDISDQQWQVDAKGYRAQPGEYNSVWQGGSMTGDRWSFITQAAIDMGRKTGSRPYGNGPITITIHAARTSNTTLIYPGTFFTGTFSALPATDTLQRGTTRLFVCIDRMENGPEIQITAVDWGLSIISNPPTLGTPATLTGDTSHSVTCQLTLNGNNESADVYVNVTPTSVGARPADTDPMWKYVGQFYNTALVTVRHLPAGSRVWFRARSMPRIRVDILGLELTVPILALPSSWAYGVASVDTTALAAPSALASSSVNASAFTIGWTNGDNTVAVEIWLASPVTDPPSFVARLAPGSTQYRILGTAPSTTYRVYVRAVDQIGGSSQATLDVTTAATDPTAPTPVGIIANPSLQV